MGVVINQSFKNTLIVFLGFAIGGINVLFLYTHFLEAEYFGLITFLLSSSNILMPLLIFGMQHTIIKFFSSYKNKIDRDNFMVTAIILPLLVIIPLAFIGTIFYDTIGDILSKKNIIIKKYTYLIFTIAILTGYFEVFFAWSKVQMKSVFGSFIREIFTRTCVTILLLSIYFEWLNSEQFIYSLVAVHFLRMLLMAFYAFKLYFPKIKSFSLPQNIKEIFSFSFYIILAGSAGTILLEIDKFMIPQMEKIEQVAYYSVGVFIATIVAIPSRAMQQIINPIIAKEMNDNNLKEVESLYKRSSINLLIAGGLLFLLINININELYLIINKPEYAVGVYIVLMISIAELFKLSLGTNGAILTNSKYYKIFFYFSISMAFSVIILNRILIEILGIEGAALATLFVVLIFNFIKIIYLKNKLGIYPYSKKTKNILTIIALLFFLFYFLKFNIHPFLSILLKSFLVALIYIFLVIRLRLSNDINKLIRKLLFK
ncbi:MAG: oligosaccharide flippase family protein [Flavobacteriaceae bacterium]|nr:oligosaccharide flippase family protein [Flavobacteriaceae bacterium]